MDVADFLDLFCPVSSPLLNLSFTSSSLLNTSCESLVQNHKAPRRLKVCENITCYIRRFNVAKEGNTSAFSKNKLNVHQMLSNLVLNNYDNHRPRCYNEAETSLSVN